MKNSKISTSSFPIGNFGEIKAKVLGWAKQFDTFCFLDNHNYQFEPHTEECILAAGIRKSICSSASESFREIQSVIDSKERWLFGHLAYDLKEDLGFVHSSKKERIGFPTIFFFEPETLLRFNKNSLEITAEAPEKINKEIYDFRVSENLQPRSGARPVGRLSREEYLRTVNQLREHILRGDCYEINFCQEMFCIDPAFDPVSTFLRLAAVSPNPFSALYRHQNSWLLCASPERFLARKNDRILSQPIKGTSRRFDEGREDEKSRAALSASEKDRSENVMVVDLVRNDLSRICKEGSVKVDELFGIYSFPQVHQMISTVSGQLRDNITFEEIVRATFPMGSMTGAPKKRVIELIEKYEMARRGIFSGALGYISPDGNFDFNVVIRSLLYNAADGYLSYQVGSGITFYSDAAIEWEECKMKAEAMENVL